MERGELRIFLCHHLEPCSLKLGFSDSSVGKESACNAGDPSSIPGSARSAGEMISYSLQYSWASLVAQLVNTHLQCRRPGFSPWVGKIPWRRERLPTPAFWPREFHGLYSPWDCKESDMTDQLSVSLNIYSQFFLNKTTKVWKLPNKIFYF